MKLVVVTYGSEGDNRPLLALSSGLKKAGHEVVFLGERAIERLAVAEGVGFQALEGDMKATVQPGGPLHKIMNEGGHPGKMAKACADFANASMVSWMRQLVEVARECDGIVFSGFAGYPALSVAEYLDMPIIGAGLFPVSPTRAFPSSLIPPVSLPGWLNYYSHKAMMGMLWRMFRGSVNEARKNVCGQAPRRRAWDDYPVVYGISPSILPQPADWPSKWQMCGAWYYRDPAWQADQALIDFIDAGEPPVYLGFGSMSGFDSQRLLSLLSPALAGKRVVYSPGWSDYDAALLPEQTFIVGDTPHDWLFPKMSVVIHHGGAGTTHAAARAGKPAVVIPFTGDQAFWAHRLAELGVAADARTMTKLTRQQFARRFAEAENGMMAQRAEALSRSMLTEDGIESAVKQITVHMS